jgi:hypothetical protein
MLFRIRLHYHDDDEHHDIPYASVKEAKLEGQLVANASTIMRGGRA